MSRVPRAAIRKLRKAWIETVSGAQIEVSLLTRNDELRDSNAEKPAKLPKVKPMPAMNAGQGGHAPT
jgi:hypothetical protein